MKLNETATIQLLLSFRKEIETLKRMVEANGEKEGARIKVSNYIKAHLTGQNFAITKVTPEKQVLVKSEDTEWKWDVKPTTAGAQKLHLTLTAIFYENGQSKERAIKTFDKVIQVDVVQPTWSDRVSSFIGNNWQWLWATILVPGAGWLWARIKSGKGKGA